MTPEKELVSDAAELRGEVCCVTHGYYLASKGNMRYGHWAVAYKRDKAQTQLGHVLGLKAVQMGLSQLQWPKDHCDAKWEVVLVRLAPVPLDSDNVGSAFKNIRDGIAQALGLDDKWEGGSKLEWSYGKRKRGNITWHADQQRSKAYGVRLELKRLSKDLSD